MIEPITVTLSRPLTIIDRQVSEITLREPKGRDLVKAGNPIRLTESGTEMDAAATTRLIAAIGNLPLKAVEDMPWIDWQACSVGVLDFLLQPESQQESSGAISSSPAGGETSSAT